MMNWTMLFTALFALIRLVDHLRADSIDADRKNIIGSPKTPIGSNLTVLGNDDEPAPTRSRQERFLFPIRKFLGFSETEGRGIKDFIGIVSTILAALLGAIAVKLNMLLVLSVISIGIGKLVLLLSALKFHQNGGQHNNWSPPVPTQVIIKEKPIPSQIYYSAADDYDYPHHHHHHASRNDDRDGVLYSYQS